MESVGPIKDNLCSNNFSRQQILLIFGLHELSLVPVPRLFGGGGKKSLVSTVFFLKIKLTSVSRELRGVFEIWLIRYREVKIIVRL